MTTSSAPPDALLALVRRYLDAIEQSDQATLEALFDPAIVQHEFPNRLVPTGAVRDRAALLEGFERGKKVLSSQRYVIDHAVVQGNQVAFEATWTATLAVPIGSLSAGDTMRAVFAVFIELRDGRIVSQRNYDCFDPF